MHIAGTGDISHHSCPLVHTYVQLSAPVCAFLNTFQFWKNPGEVVWKVIDPTEQQKTRPEQRMWGSGRKSIMSGDPTAMPAGCC